MRHPRSLPQFVLAALVLLAALPLRASTIAEALAASRERAVSAMTSVPKAGDQSAPRVASNGAMSLVVWTDREGTTDLYGARLDRDGRMIDAQPILLARNAAALAVMWNGSRFATFLYDRTVVFVSPDGAVSAPKPLPVTSAYEFVATASSGSTGRVLYVARSFDPAVMILDGNGDAAVPAFQLTTPGGVWPRYVAGGGGDGEFLILRSFSAAIGDPRPPILAERIALDGRLVSSSVSPLPFSDVDSLGLAGDANGYLVVKQFWESGGKVIAARLDRNGVYHGENVTLLAPDPSDRQMSCCYSPVVISNGGGFTVAWHSALTNGHAYTWLADVPASGNTAIARRLYDWVGITSGVAIATSDSRTDVITSAWLLDSASGADIFAQRVDGTATAPQLLTTAAPRQRNVRVAAGMRGSLVVWNETAADSATWVYARRFASDGTPQDPKPIAVARFPFNFSVPPEPALNAVASASGDTYLITWSENVTLGRRLNASTGQWLDAEPFTISASRVEDLSLASALDGALAAWSAVDGFGARSVVSRRIAWTGNPLPTPATEVASDDFYIDVAVASNGTDYLVAWSRAQTPCIVLCLPSPFDIVAARVRADGTVIDEEPLVIERQKGFSLSSTIAWSGGRYVVAWADGSEVRAAGVSAEGAIVETGSGGRGIVVDSLAADHFATPLLLARAGELILFTRDAQASPSFVASWRSSSIATDEPLSYLRNARRVLLVEESPAPASLDAASGPAGVVVAYDRRSDAAASFVTRVYLRSSGIPAPRRRVAADAVVVPPCTAPAPLANIPNFHPGYYIVDLRNGTNFREESERLASEYGFRLLDVYDVVLGGFSAEMSATAVASVRCEPAVQSVEPDGIFRPAATYR